METTIKGENNWSNAYFYGRTKSQNLPRADIHNIFLIYLCIDEAALWY